jgi:hypothetical protein
MNMKIRTLALAVVLGLGFTAGVAAAKTKPSHIVKPRVKGKNHNANARKAAQMNKARARAARKAHKAARHS